MWLAEIQWRLKNVTLAAGVCRLAGGQDPLHLADPVTLPRSRCGAHDARRAYSCTHARNNSPPYFFETQDGRPSKKAHHLAGAVRQTGAERSAWERRAFNHAGHHNYDDNTNEKKQGAEGAG